MSSSSPSQFGSNQWLVEEMFLKFQQDPSSVDPAWHDFLADYAPDRADGGGDLPHSSGRPNGSRRSSSTRAATATHGSTAPAPTATAPNGSAPTSPYPPTP